MSAYRIIIVELKSRANDEAERAEAIPAVPGIEEVKVFEQVVEDLNLKTIIRQINATPRRRKAKAGSS